MQIELRLPDLDLSGTPVTVCSWHAQVGQRIVEGDRLIEVLAGDVAIDLPAPAGGILIERCVALDQTVKTDQRLAVIEAE